MESNYEIFRRDARTEFEPEIQEDPSKIKLLTNLLNKIVDKTIKT